MWVYNLSCYPFKIVPYPDLQLSEGDFGQYVKYGIPPKKKLGGFPVTKDALLPAGRV